MTDTKVCIRCGVEYPLTSEFWHKGNGKNGFYTYCKMCSRERANQWNKNHPESHREINKKWQKENHEKVSQNQKRWVSKNREKKREYDRRWKQENPDKKKANHQRRRALQKGAKGSYTAEQIQALRLQQENRCFHCGVSFDEKKMNIDHWIPLTKNGSNDIENIRLLCVSCNCSKADKLPCEWDNRYCV